MKIILIILSVILVLAVVVGVGFWYLSSRPFYKPGMVSEGERLNAPLNPPTQIEGAETWMVEPDIELTHFADGQGRNVLVVHGGPGSPFLAPVEGLMRLNDKYQFHYYAQRGCGESTRPFDRFASSNTYQNMDALEKELGLGAQIADIERIRQILGDDKLILVGHSWGGFLAALYAAEFPDNVESLVLISPANVLIFPQPDSESDLFASVRARLPVDQQTEYDEFMAAYMDFNALFDKSEDDLIAMNEQFAEYYGRVADTPVSNQESDWLQQGRPGGWMVWAQYLSMGKRHDYRSALAAVEAPVLVIHGTDDLQSELASRLYSDAFPNSQFTVFEGASHFAFQQQPVLFADTVAKFLGE